jgi:arabinose-5-phosphate isomerase
MTRTGFGMTAIIDDDGVVIGVFTDGDLRRAIDGDTDLQGTPIGTVMTTECKTVREDTLAAEAVRLMEDYSITALLVANKDNRLVGAFNIHDLMHAGVV